MTWVRRKGGVYYWTGPPIEYEPLESELEPEPPRQTDPSERKPDRTGCCIDCRKAVARRTIRCLDCHQAFLIDKRKPVKESPLSAIEDVMDRLSRNLWPRPTLGVTCECGCLLIDADERCPACLVWAELDAVRASWNQVSEEAA